MAKYWFDYRPMFGKIQTNIKQWWIQMNEEMKTASELVKDPSSFSALTYAWIIFLAVWGGLVRVLREMNLGEKTWRQHMWTMFTEMLTSGFVGVLTFYACQAANYSPLTTAIMTSIGGYMGVRALEVLEAIYKRWAGKNDPT